MVEGLSEPLVNGSLSETMAKEGLKSERQKSPGVFATGVGLLQGPLKAVPVVIDLRGECENGGDVEVAVPLELQNGAGKAVNGLVEAINGSESRIGGNVELYPQGVEEMPTYALPSSNEEYDVVESVIECLDEKVRDVGNYL